MVDVALAFVVDFGDIEAVGLAEQIGVVARVVFGDGEKAVVDLEPAGGFVVDAESGTAVEIGGAMFERDDRLASAFELDERSERMEGAIASRDVAGSDHGDGRLAGR